MFMDTQGTVTLITMIYMFNTMDRSGKRQADQYG
ncbi:hypothetical protein SVI_0341 [Shewanella violacea DSS12]|uniref:Uncharacterized protein n=1 Tax=Shewanella violacea (strain JCM 10179 / CIP 106290 / LMG 19151 / DSS12) TaxID=637905 RepID=D4ZET2_SHEVD|nr:hypothetical protein SVI_0341 [Shewanella violacea DSS12]